MFNRKYKLIFFALIIFFGWRIGQSFFDEKVIASELQNFDFKENKVLIDDGGLLFEVSSDAKNIDEFLQEQKIKLTEHDVVYPSRSEKIHGGTRVIIQRAKKITIKEGGETNEIYTFEQTVEQAIWEDKKIDLGQDDVTVPDRNTPIVDGMKISVTHVLIKEETKDVSIDFKTISNEDDKLGWRVKKVTQKGEKGVKEVKYKVVYNDGKEISRKILESNVTKQPVEEIVTQGTFVKTGKAKRGDGTWYAFKGGLFAASRDIPRGGFAKVTNMDNGSSVIVQINDYGPQAPERIIDLDKVAFAKIGNLGQGVLHNVKVEQVLN